MKTDQQKLSDLTKQISLGEDSFRQFKQDIKNADSLASEITAFANNEGGLIIIGVADNGTTPGLELSDVARINQLISNVASQHIRSPISVTTENISLENGKIIILLNVPKGMDKPYFDKNGVIWFKCGADKRKINSKEELKRLFQSSDQLHADEIPVNAKIEDLEIIKFSSFLKENYDQDLPEEKIDRIKLLKNMNLANESGQLNLAGLLLFGVNPQKIKPQFTIKGILYPGEDINIENYIDTDEFTGPIYTMFQGALFFITRNLHKIQKGSNVNSPGTLEIPQIALEELLVNALVHRDYTISAPIRIFIFTNRIEIISPGHLPNNLTVPKVIKGNSNIRNPILVSFVTKGLLPYKGIGSGITRALKVWPQIEFVDDREGNLFKVTIFREN